MVKSYSYRHKLPESWKEANLRGQKIQHVIATDKTITQAVTTTSLSVL